MQPNRKSIIFIVFSVLYADCVSEINVDDDDDDDDAAAAVVDDDDDDDDEKHSEAANLRQDNADSANVLHRSYIFQIPIFSVDRQTHRHTKAKT